jgi:hypothetical protein
MKLRSLPLVFALLLTLLTGCQPNDPGTTPAPTATTKTELIAANNWKINRLADANGRLLNNSQLSAQTLALAFFDFQFRDNFTVRAFDRQTRQIVNGGDWKFTDDNTGIDVKVTGFTGVFPLLELTRTSLVLQQLTKVDGKDANIRLEFVPAI